MGEIRRVLNSFLQMIEQDRSHSMVMAATNHPGILDRAHFRRFDDILHFELPDESQIAELLKMRLGGTAQRSIVWSDLASRAFGLSYAEVARAADDVIKDALVSGRARVREGSASSGRCRNACRPVRWIRSVEPPGRDGFPYTPNCRR